MKSCQQKIDAVLGHEQYIGNRQIVIEAHERAAWLISAIDNMSWPQPPTLHLSINGQWQTSYTYHDWHSNKAKAKEHFNRYKHLLPAASARLENRATITLEAFRYTTSPTPRLELITRLIKACALRLRSWCSMAKRYFQSPWENG